MWQAGPRGGIRAVVGPSRRAGRPVSRPGDRAVSALDAGLVRCRGGPPGTAAEAAVRASRGHGLGERALDALLVVLCTMVPPSETAQHQDLFRYRSGGRASPRHRPGPRPGLNGHALPDRTRTNDRGHAAGSGALHQMGCQAPLIPAKGQRVSAHLRAALRPVAPGRAVSVARALDPRVGSNGAGARSSNQAPNVPTRCGLRPPKLTWDSGIRAFGGTHERHRVPGADHPFGGDCETSLQTWQARARQAGASAARTYRPRPVAAD